MNFFDTLKQAAVDDSKKEVIPSLIIFLNSIGQNPSALNLAVALAQLNASLLGAAPAIAQDLAKQGTAWLAAHLQALEAPAAPPAA